MPRAVWAFGVVERIAGWECHRAKRCDKHRQFGERWWFVGNGQ